MRSPRDRSMQATTYRQRGPAVALAVVQRWRKTYSIREIALVLDVGQATVDRWSRSEAEPCRRVAQDICERADLYLRRLEHNRRIA